jgi:hypothetical protein
LLRRYVCRGRDANVRVDKEEYEDLAEARLCFVDKFKWRDFVLVDIGEGKAAIP